MKKHTSMIMAAVMAVTILAGRGASGETIPTDAPTAAPTKAVTAVAKTEAETATAETEATTEAAQATSEETEILVVAVASPRNAYEEELIPTFQSKCPDVTIKGTYDSSGKLQTQTEGELEADVFMSAATKRMTALGEEGMIVSDTITDLLENKIVLIIPTGSDSKLAKLEDIENAESVVPGDPVSISAGQYTEEALTNSGIWDKIQGKVSLGINATEVLNQVTVASADADIVHVTDAANMADKAEVVAEAPEGSLAKKVTYPVAVVKNIVHEERAKDFVELLRTDKAMRVFEAYGFTKGE